MSWSGSGIMDGTLPIAHEANILEEVLGLVWHDDEPEPTEDDMYQSEDQIATWCELTNDPIAFEVWGQMLVGAHSDTITEGHRALIIAAIDTDLARTDTFGWSDPLERKHVLRELREHIEVMGTGKVIILSRLHKRRLTERTQEAMQGVLDASDPSVVQKAVARMLMDLVNGDGLNDWVYAATAIVKVGKALSEAVDAGVPLADAVETARRECGA